MTDPLAQITKQLETASQPWTREQARECFVKLGWSCFLEPQQDALDLKQGGTDDNGAR